MQQVGDGIDIHSFLDHQVKHYAGIEGAAAAAHREAVEGAESDGGCNTPARLHGAHFSALTQVGDNYFAFCSLTRILRQDRSYVLVRESIKAVAPNARFGKRTRNCIGSRDLTLGAMKRRVEACHLQQLRMQLCQRFDRREVMRLMKRRQGRQFLEIFNHSWVHHHGCGVDGAAVNDTVPGADQMMAMISEVAFEPTQQKTERIFMGCSCRELLICDLTTDKIHRRKVRLVANPINLALVQNHTAPELDS